MRSSPALPTDPLPGDGAPANAPWLWEEQRWRGIVNKVRAGRSLKPARWKDGARCAVALSFDSDHESTELRDGGLSPGRLSQGQYGARVGVPRVLALLDRHSIPATFFVPAVVALLYPEEQRRIVQAGHELALHGWIHEFNSVLEPQVEAQLLRQSVETLTACAGVAPVGMRTP
jgi:peptidoglycan/xylan/chitin deacetylase (PgdA/CDA1 family)